MNFYQELGFLVFGSRLKRLSETFLNDVNRIYRLRGIPFDASWFPVFYILSNRSEVSIREISDELNISHSAVSQLISALKRKGLIKAVVSKKDARHRNITLSSRGELLLEKVIPVWEALQQAMVELARESVQSRKILESLTAIEQNLSKKTLSERVQRKFK